jgi:hypothetical protein
MREREREKERKREKEKERESERERQMFSIVFREAILSIFQSLIWTKLRETEVSKKTLNIFSNF